jgi:hypothetical protein
MIVIGKTSENKAKQHQRSIWATLTTALQTSLTFKTSNQSITFKIV